MSRPTWRDFYLGIAQASSARGDCTRSKVGAVIVKLSPDGRHLTSLGYNGVESGGAGCLSGACPRGKFSYDELPSLSPYGPGTGHCIASHAEMNAYYNSQFDVIDSKIYITREPCNDCRGFLLGEGVSAFFWPGGYIDYAPRL